MGRSKKGHPFFSKAFARLQKNLLQKEEKRTITGKGRRGRLGMEIAAKCLLISLLLEAESLESIRIWPSIADRSVREPFVWARFISRPFMFYWAYRVLLIQATLCRDNLSWTVQWRTHSLKAETVESSRKPLNLTGFSHWHLSLKTLISYNLINEQRPWMRFENGVNVKRLNNYFETYVLLFKQRSKRNDPIWTSPKGIHNMLNSHAYRYMRRHVNIINYQVGCSKCMFSNITHFYLIMLQMLFIAYIVFFLIFQKLLKKHAIYKFTEKRKRTKSSAKLQHTQTVWLENIFIRNYKKMYPVQNISVRGLQRSPNPHRRFTKKLREENGSSRENSNKLIITKLDFDTWRQTQKRINNVQRVLPRALCRKYEKLLIVWNAEVKSSPSDLYRLLLYSTYVNKQRQSRYSLHRQKQEWMERQSTTILTTLQFLKRLNELNVFLPKQEQNWVAAS